MTLADSVAGRRFTPTHQLLRDGWSSRQISRAVAIGEIVRVRQGWYCAPTVEPAEQRAAGVGGQLTCQSAARMLGLAARRTTDTHVAVSAHASRLRILPGILAVASSRPNSPIVVHWSARPADPESSRSVLDILKDLAGCESPEFTIAAVDSAIRLGLIRLGDWLDFLPSLPRKLGTLLSSVNGKSGSITESLCRVRLLPLGIVPTLQFRVAGVGFVDMLIGERLVIEIDGRKYHTDAEQFEADRQRDARLSILGFRVLRFSYRQVMSNWAQVRGSILAAIARGDHLAPHR
jgi:very-short-patch-repair endonuclease